VDEEYKKATARYFPFHRKLWNNLVSGIRIGINMQMSAGQMKIADREGKVEVGYMYTTRLLHASCARLNK